MKHKSIIPIVLCAVICSVFATGCGDDGTITVNTPTQSVTESTHASDSTVGSTEGTTDNKKPNETNPAASSSTSNSSHEQSSSSSENNSSKNDPQESSKTESSKSDSSQTSKPDKSDSSQTSKPDKPSPKPTQKPKPKPTEKPAAKPTQHTHTWVNDTKKVTKTVTVTPAKTVTYSRWHYSCNDCGKTWVWDEGVNPNDYYSIHNEIDNHILDHAYNGGAGSYSTKDTTYTKTTPAVTKDVTQTVTTGRHCTTCGKKETY
jgi:hypothetical protein